MGKFQSEVRYRQGYGVVGEVSHDGPKRAKPGVLKSASEKNNVWGRVFTLNSDGETVRAGGDGFFWGIFANPKTGVFTGRVGDDPAQYIAPNGVVGEFVDMGEIIVAVTEAIDYDEPVGYLIADGTIVKFVAGDTTMKEIPKSSIARVRQMDASGGLISLRLTN